MIDLNRSRLPCQFEVSVGHSRVTVTGATREDVIQQARRALCVEMPRLYDVIRNLDPSRFHVVPLNTPVWDSSPHEFGSCPHRATPRGRPASMGISPGRNGTVWEGVAARADGRAGSNRKGG